MQVEHDLTVEDVVAFQRYRLAHPIKPKRISWAAGLITVCTMLAVLLALIFIPWPGWFLFVLFILAILVIALVSPRVQRQIIAFLLRRQLRQEAYAKLLGWRRLEITPDGLSITTVTATSTTKWSGVLRIVVAENHAFFYLSPIEAYMLPRRALATENEFREFVKKARHFRDEDRFKHEGLEYFEVQQPREKETGIRADGRTSI
jgi:hypothetical protein